MIKFNVYPANTLVYLVFSKLFVYHVLIWLIDYNHQLANVNKHIIVMEPIVKVI